MYPPEHTDGKIRDDVLKQSDINWCGCQSSGNVVKVEHPLMKSRIETLNTVLSLGYDLDNIPVKRDIFLRHFRAPLSCNVLIYLNLKSCTQ